MLRSLRVSTQRALTTKSNTGTFRYAVFKPAGNDTGLITGIIPDAERRKEIASLLQEMNPSIEQVGFVNPDSNNAELIMAGGEFCGNATRSAAYQILRGKPGKIFIKVSGVKKKLLAGVTKRGEAYCQIPIYEDPYLITPDPKHPGNALVTMEGITHYIDFDFSKIRGLTTDEIKAKARKEMADMGIDKQVCCGIIYVDQREDWCAVHPIVYIRDVDTLFYETACGSGTTALGQLLALQQGKSINEMPILQPSGLNIRVTVSFDGKKFGYAQIQSPIEILQNGVLELPQNHTKETSQSINTMLQNIIQKRPKLRKLIADKSILDYLRPALTWKQQENIFPHAKTLEMIITAHIEKLYGEDAAALASKQLKDSWVVETGAHLHIPRRYNNLAQTEGAQINSLLFQGQVLWALANQRLGNHLAIGMNSGRVPLDNTNSGAYLDLPSLKTPMTLASKKKHPDSPQTFISARTKEDIEQKLELLAMYKKQRMIQEQEYELGLEILTNFLVVQSSFSDQVATTHALMLNKLLPNRQITLDSEPVGAEFIIKLLKDPTSLTYSIFTDPYRKALFYQYLKSIQTGWAEHGSPFYQIIQKGEGYRLVDYSGDLSPETIIKGLEERTLWPTGVMKFFAEMVEGGLLSVGGWTQTGYCTDIKMQSVKLLHKFGYKERAEALHKMPTHIAAVGPCWGIDKINGKFQLLDAITTLLDTSIVNLSYITNLTATQTLLIAAPTLYEFLLREPPVINYKDLTEISRYAFARR